jgi:hypothetical protein
MRKNKTSKLNPFVLVLAALMPLSKVLAQANMPMSVYGPPAFQQSRGTIFVNILLWMAVFLIPIAIIVGIIIYLRKRIKQRNAKEISEIRKP